MKTIPVGIQLYTVRADCAEDFEGTLAALAEMGYQGVETAGNYGSMPPSDFAAMLKRYSLKLCGQHVGLAQLQDGDSDVYKYAKACACPYVTTSLAGQVEQNWKSIIPEVEKAGAVAASRGCTFTYHNHAAEFAMIDGEYALDLLYDQTDPGNVQAELDVYWIKKGGEDPCSYLRKYLGRLPQIHLKDMDLDDGGFTEVGEGLMDLPGVFAAAQDSDTEWIIVEQDQCKGPALESARLSMDNLKKADLV